MNEFPNVKKNFGFGCMRLPMDGERVDYAEFTRMIDRFMAEGFNYFDTARVYIGGQSETALVAAVQAVMGADAPLTAAMVWAQIRTGLPGLALQAVIVPASVIGLSALLRRDDR